MSPVQGETSFSVLYNNLFWCLENIHPLDTLRQSIQTGLAPLRAQGPCHTTQ